MAKSTEQEKVQKQMERDLLRNDFGLQILKLISNFESKETNLKLNDKDVIHVFAEIIARKSK